MLQPSHQSPNEAFASLIIPEQHREVIEAAIETVRRTIVERQLDPKAILLAGYVPGASKTEEGEFATSGGRHQFFFGTPASIQLAPDTADEDERGERWVANPLNYALQPGAMLGIYDRVALEQHAIEPMDTDYGTLTVEATQDVVDVARILELDVH